jgi:hypothetical protein
MFSVAELLAVWVSSRISEPLPPPPPAAHFVPVVCAESAVRTCVFVPTGSDVNLSPSKTAIVPFAGVPLMG